MGRKTQKAQRLGAGSPVCPPRDAAGPAPGDALTGGTVSGRVTVPAGGWSSGPAVAEAWDYAKRQKARIDIVGRLMSGDVGEVEQRSLASAAKVLNDYERAELRREEDERDDRATVELAKHNRTKARTRLGGVREDEAPELPVAGRPAPH